MWIVRTGAPWRDLPHCFGNWFSVWKRFRRWALKGVFERVLKELSGEPDFEYVLRSVVPSRSRRAALEDARTTVF